MSRDFYINGESLVQVKGPVGSAIATLTQLGLSTDPIEVHLESNHNDLIVDAWGDKVPVDVQYKLSSVEVTMKLIHFDPDVLNECIRLSMAGPTTVGLTGRAGMRLGNNLPRFAAGNFYIGLNITSPVENRPWRFFFSYLPRRPVGTPLGTEKTVIRTTWRCIPFTTDPWGGGTGALNALLYDHNSDT